MCGFQTKLINFIPPNIIALPVASFIALVSPFNHSNDATFLAFVATTITGGVVGSFCDGLMNPSNKKMMAATSLSLGLCACLLNLYNHYHPSFYVSFNFKFTNNIFSFNITNKNDDDVNQQ